MTNPTDTDTPVRALTMRPPWGTAIARLGKNIENRTWGTKYRGPLLIHQGSTWSEHGVHDPRVLAMWKAVTGDEVEAIHPGSMPTGAVVATAELVDCHQALPRDTCCSPWGDRLHDDLEGQPLRYRVFHWVLAEVVALDVPVKANGKQGLWTPTEDLIGDVARAIDDQQPLRRPRRHPAAVTADRLLADATRYANDLTQTERVAMSLVARRLERLAREATA